VEPAGSYWVRGEGTLRKLGGRPSSAVGMQEGAEPGFKLYLHSGFSESTIQLSGVEDQSSSCQEGRR